MKKRILLISAFAGLLALAGCGGGDDGNIVTAASTNATANITASNGATVISSVQNQNFAFDTGVPEFGTTGATTVTFTGQPPTTLPDNAAAQQQSFRISEGSNTATGVMEFGSCKFRVTSSTFTSGPLVNGQTVTINNCALTVSTAGIPADNTPRQLTLTLTLNARVSKVITVSVTIRPDGTVLVNNITITTVPTRPYTGG
jgi:hypothetical protein